MIGLELRISGIGSDHTANWATTIAHINILAVISGAVNDYWISPPHD